MSTQFIEILDNALERLRDNDSISEILEKYADQAEYLAPLLYAADSLNSIPPVEIPSDEVMQMDRVEFLASIEPVETLAVSPGLFVRLQGWISSIIPRAPIRKENQKMSTLLARATLVLAMLFGATGGAYAMADNSLPNEPMYGAKIAMEQLQLNMASDPAGIAALHLVRARNRFKEVVQLTQEGISPEAETMTMLETHLNKALHFAAQVKNEGECLEILTQARAMVQEQLQVMSQIQINDGDPTQEALRLALRLLNQFQNQVQAGMQDTNAFQLRYQNQFANPSAPGNPDCPNCPCDGCDPVGVQNQNQNQQQNQNQIQNQNQQLDESVPGDCPNCPCDGCEPAGTQNQNQNQNQNQQLDESVPGGCPNCPCVDCDGDQSQDQDRDQTQDQLRDQSCDNTQPEPPAPGDCPLCPCDGCEPDGSQNQNGAKP